MRFDPVYIFYVFLPLLALTGLCHLWLKLAYARYSKVLSQRGVTGGEAARYILQASGIDDVRVEPVDGWLTDHYSPSEKVLRLSPQNYSQTSLAALGIAAHEVGHAIQHARGYAPLKIRNLAVPLANAGSSLGYLVIMIGLMMSRGHGAVNAFTLTGLAMIAGIAVFQLINLPVEFDASRRALQVLPQLGILTPEENRAARNVLLAAAMTYVAATVAALAEVAYWAWRLGLFSGGSSSRGNDRS